MRYTVAWAQSEGRIKCPNNFNAKYYFCHFVRFGSEKNYVLFS